MGGRPNPTDIQITQRSAIGVRHVTFAANMKILVSEMNTMRLHKSFPYKSRNQFSFEGFVLLYSPIFPRGKCFKSRRILKIDAFAKFKGERGVNDFFRI